MNKMKKITATAAAMAISAGLAVGGTLAYLNSVTETKTNTFTSGKNITTTLTETEWTADSGKNYTPGDVIRKNPVMKNESDQAVYMAIKVDYTDAQGSLMSAEAFEKYASVTDFDLDDWEKIAVNQDGSEMWVYKSAVEADSATEALFNNVEVYTGITEEWSSAAKIYSCKQWFCHILFLNS
jgi:predicted ribosomally synthesized peptide with SipW-like signal peptide